MKSNLFRSKKQILNMRVRAHTRAHTPIVIHDKGQEAKNKYQNGFQHEEFNHLGFN